MARKDTEARRWFTCTEWMQEAPARPVINRQQLLKEALALLDEGGLEGLTMRKLAERLGVQAASLYNHVCDKDELMALLADAISAEIPPLDTTLPWRERLEALALNYRRVLRAHRDAALVFAASPPVGNNRLMMIEQVLATLIEAGFAPRDAYHAAFVLHTLVMGFALEEAEGRWDEEGGSAPDSAFDLEEAFRAGVRALLDGLKPSTDAAKPATPSRAARRRDSAARQAGR